MTIEELQTELLTDLSVELVDEPTYSENKLKAKIKNAIREVRERRNYSATNYTEEQIICDLSNNYYSVIRNLALYDYNQIGGEFQTASSESSTSRTYMKRTELLANIHAFVKVL